MAKFDYAVEYTGKKPIEDVIACQPSRCNRRLSVQTEPSSPRGNRIYCGDNLGVLRCLCDDDEICGKVSLVYIDPPFSTGARLASRDAEHAYDDTFAGAEFLEFLRQRVILIRELLACHGSLYLHLDGKKVFPMKVILDEIFGPSNFRSCITRKKSNRKNYTRKTYGNISDYILFYTKTSEYTWNRPYEPWSNESPPKEYRYVEEETGRRYMKVPVHAPGIRNGDTGREWRGKSPPPGKHWQYPPAVLDELDARGEIYWSPNGNPRRKIYLDESPGIPVQDIWLGHRDAHNQNIDVTGYPTEKNLEMLKRIVLASSNEGDLVMDCFMGSGTTLVAAEQDNRRWIGVDSSVKAVETTLTRMAEGSRPMGDYVKRRIGSPRESPRLFPMGVLKTGFDLYFAKGCVPKVPSSQALKTWAGLFRAHHSAILK